MGVTTASKKDGLKGLFLQETHQPGTTHGFSRSLKIYQKEVDNLISLIIRGCIPSLSLKKKKGGTVSNPILQFLNHRIFL